jgi:hypothetical protein
MDGVIDMAELTTWTDLEAARDAVAEGEIFAEGMNDADGYAVRLRRHGIDAIAEVREGDGDWALVDSVDDDGVISLRDIDTEVTYHAVV